MCLNCFGGYVSDIKNCISEGNDLLFRQFVKYNQEGIIRAFDNEFARIKDGKLLEESPLYIEFEKLLNFYKRELLKVNYSYSCPYSGFHDDSLGINLFKQKFYSCIITLMISIFIQFQRKGNKKYFSENRQYSRDITDIRLYLQSMLNRDELNPLLKYMVCIKKKSTLLNKSNMILNTNITELSLYQTIEFNYEYNRLGNLYYFVCNPKGYYKNTTDHVLHSKDNLLHLENYYLQLLDLLNLVNKVEFIYEGLKESCVKDDGSENSYIKEIVLLIEGKDDLSNLNTNSLSK